MKNHEKLSISRIARSLFTLSVVLMSAVTVAVAQTRHLPIDFFVDLLPQGAIQGVYDPASGNVLQMDVYGKVNTQLNFGLPTTLDGDVTVKNLGDGTERVTVNVHTRGALCWGSTFTEGNILPAFGYSPFSVFYHFGPAALGDANFRVVFVPQPTGQFQPLESLIESFQATATCEGVLRAASGYPDGTDGFAHTTQVTLLGTGGPTGCPPAGDHACYPAEKIQFKPRGQ